MDRYPVRRSKYFLSLMSVLVTLQLFLGPLALMLMARYLGLIPLEAVLTSPQDSNHSESTRTECV